MPRIPEQLIRFDPEKVASLEVKMWRGYYEIKGSGKVEKIKGVVGLFFGLNTLCQEQFQFSRVESLRMASYLFAASVAFGRDRENKYGSHEKISLPFIQRAYAYAKERTGAELDPWVAAVNELAWWRAHRTSREDPDKLMPAIASMGDLFAEIYQISDRQEFHIAAMHRMAAAAKRDEGVKSSKLTDEDWQKVEESLLSCYTLIKETVQSQP